MPKASKPGFYAVRKGRQTGIFLTWDECEAQVKGFAGATYKKLSTEADARDFLVGKTPGTSSVVVAPPSTSKAGPVPVPSTSRTSVPSDSNIVSNEVRTRHTGAKDAADFDVVYCDGACKGNGKQVSVAGVGVWWGHNDPRNISERCPGDQTNNRAELIAIVRILETTPPLKRRLVIRTDSKYSIQCVTSWIFKWMRNGFLAADGKPVKNCALIKYLTALLHARRSTSQVVEFEHVRGHVGIEGNEAADQLANLGATKPDEPERDWQKLEEAVLHGLSKKSIKKVDDDQKTYADGFLDEDKLANLADTGTSNVKSVLRPLSKADEERPKQTTAAIAPRVKPVCKIPPEAPVPTGAELEAYVACLLDDSELTTLGKGGDFDSDF